MKIQDLEDIDLEDIDREDLRNFYLSFQESLLYTDHKYLTLLKEHLSCDVRYLIKYEGSNITLAMPYAVKDSEFGKIYNSLPYFGSNGGVIGSGASKELKLELVNKFFSLAEEDSALSAVLITNPLSEDDEFFMKNIECSYTDERIGQITSLPNVFDEDLLLSKFSNPRPRNIRKALKENVSVLKQNIEGIDFLYQTHFENMSSIGGTPKKHSFFKNIPKYFQDSEWNIYTAIHNSKPIAALLVFYFNQTVEYFTPATLSEYRNYQPMSLIIFEAMKDAIKRGQKNWNWGGTWLSQTGVYDFKKKWGAIDYPYHYFIKVYDDDLGKYSKKTLNDHFYGFYTIPYEKLG